MTLSNWILIIVFAILLIVVIVMIVIVKRKARDYEGVCGINRGNHDKHRNDHLL